MCKASDNMLLVSPPVNVLPHLGASDHGAAPAALSFSERYVPVQSVGLGSTASVTLAVDSLTKTKVALKAVKKSKMSKRKVLQEISVQARVSQHPYIATLYDAAEMADTYTLVEEYMPNGDLFEVIEPDRGMPEARALRFALQIVSALEYMHQCGFVHRDVKPENVCLASDYSCRLIDFGHAAHLADCKQDDYVGTVPYMAFELLNGERKHIDFRASDMWAFGATVFVMCTGKFPWREATYDDKEFAHYAAGSAGPCHRQRWESFSPALVTLLRHTMCIDTHRRWNATQARCFIEQHWGSQSGSPITSPCGSPIAAQQPIQTQQVPSHDYHNHHHHHKRPHVAASPELVVPASATLVTPAGSPDTPVAMVPTNNNTPSPVPSCGMGSTQPSGASTHSGSQSKAPQIFNSFARSFWRPHVSWRGHVA